MTCGRTDHTKFASAPKVEDAYYNEEANDIAQSEARKAAANPRTSVPIILNKYGHEDHCNLMFPTTLGTEDDRCDCAAMKRTAI